MKKLLILTLIVIFSQDMIAQQNMVQSPDYNTVERVNLMLQGIMASYHFGKTPQELNEAMLEDVEGTPYWNKSFINGDIITEKGEVLAGIPLRFNMYDNVMEVKVKNIPYVIPSEKLVKRVLLEDKKFDYLKFKIGKKEQLGYLELIEEGDISIYSYTQVEFNRAEPPKPMHEKPKPAEFIQRKPVYLILKKGEDIAMGIKNKKEFLNLVGKNKKEAQKYLKLNNLNFKNEEDFKNIIAYYKKL